MDKDTLRDRFEHWYAARFYFSVESVKARRRGDEYIPDSTLINAYWNGCQFGFSLTKAAEEAGE